MALELLPAFEYRRVRWRNALGWSREIARESDDAGREVWRVSIAEIDHDCQFSAFSGLQRQQVLLEGNGFNLTFADGSGLSSLPPHGRIAYDGGQAPACALLDGPVRVFNLFHDPQRVCAALHHRPLVGTLLIFAEPQTHWLVYLIGGQLRVREGDRLISLAQGDSLRVNNVGVGRRRLLLEGGGELLLVSVGPP